MHKKPLTTPERESLCWLALGILIGSAEEDAVEWPEHLPVVYFGDNQVLARAVQDGDAEAVAATLREKIPALSQVDKDDLGEPVASVMKTIEADALMAEINLLSRNCERVQDGAYNIENIRKLRDSLGKWLEYQGQD